MELWIFYNSQDLIFFFYFVFCKCFFLLYECVLFCFQTGLLCVLFFFVDSIRKRKRTKQPQTRKTNKQTATTTTCSIVSHIVARCCLKDDHAPVTPVLIRLQCRRFSLFRLEGLPSLIAVPQTDGALPDCRSSNWFAWLPFPEVWETAARWATDFGGRQPGRLKGTLTA